jgi:DNA polymerase elongation subunit (family B)
MSYVDAYFDRERDQLYVVERVNGKREYTDYPARYVFYYEDVKGKHRSIYNTPVSRVSTKQNKDFQKELAIHKGKQIYEADINPIFRCLEDHYIDRNAPNMHICFFDIEVDFDPTKGFSKPADPFMPITSISCYLEWTKQLITIAVPPKTLTIDEAKDTVKEFDNTYIVENEAELLQTFLGVIEDADILSGWNSEGYDIPYTVNRIIKVLSKDDARKMCLWSLLPRKRKFERFGNEEVTYDLIGRVHLDYMQLYRKYTYEERHSFSLDAISVHELGEEKTLYEGTLDSLYNNDFKTFIEYNRQDVMLISKLNDKLKFIDLANELAHANTVLLQTTMGAVAVTEQAIINETHKRGMVVPNRPHREPHSTSAAVGAYVAHPQKGLHDYIGSIDINSLYPSIIRALNMGPETIVGQIKQDATTKMIEERIQFDKKTPASAWEGEFATVEYTEIMRKNRAFNCTVEWTNGTETTHTAAELYGMIFENNSKWGVSANGTIFTYEFEAIIPGLLEKWFSERKQMQDKLREAIQARNKVEQTFWDKRQLVKKINLNSLYGALLHPGCRFFDLRLGQSITLTGRTITKHMAAKTNEIIIGEYNHRGTGIIYGDTDSVYFSAYPMVKEEVEAGKMSWTKESCVELYDKIADEVNKSFPRFMYEAFHAPESKGRIIKGGREMVASKGLFITKKRYAVLIYDLEGTRQDKVEGTWNRNVTDAEQHGKVKAIGLDLKRSDTPKFVQDFLSDILLMVLTDKTETEIIKFIQSFRLGFRDRPGWEKGTPKRVNNLTEYVKKEQRLGKANMPGHVRASMNWNNVKKMYKDQHSLDIMDGAKVIVCRLKNNPLGYTSIAYPIDELRIPQWFKELSFDNEGMEEAIINKKLDNLIGVLDYDLGASEQNNTFSTLFEF